MLKSALKGAVAGFVVALILLAGSWLGPRHLYQQRHRQHYYDTSGSPEGEITDNTDERLARYTLWLERFTGLLVIVSIVPWWFLYRADKTARATANAAKASADIAERTLYISQRAYVSVLPKWLLETHQGSKSVANVGFWMVHQNAGNTPAQNMINRTAAVFLVHSEENAFDYEDAVGKPLPGMPVTVGPHSEITTDIQKFSAAHMHKVIDGTASLFLCGWLEYDDVFEKTPTHGVEWCFKVSIEGSLVTGGCQARFDVYDQHNRHYDGRSKRSIENN